jgi:hypothetical protein
MIAYGMASGPQSRGSHFGTTCPQLLSAPHVRVMLATLLAKSYPPLQVKVAVLPKVTPSGVDTLPLANSGTGQLTGSHDLPSPM